ncbi:5'-methylthioadenosine/S-adenosylhomocysteine nucleosidase [Homoserinibacter sp. GY 40078]|nr:5'-methylthioadenosine/S-adenosylhomocysteine nucleosidase [Homoserinibacter sp. GY 40078]
MPVEAEALLARVVAAELQPEVAGVHWWRGTIGERDVVVVRGGVGLVNAALATTAVLARIEAWRTPELVVSAGTAGGIGSRVAVGDVVLAEECVLGDADARAFGYALGQVPGMPEHYRADPGAIARASELELACGLPVRVGSVVSSDAFVMRERAARLELDFPDTVLVDMESAAIAQVAHRHEIPFVGVRAVSDLVDGDANHEQFRLGAEEASERSAAVVAALVTR